MEDIFYLSRRQLSPADIAVPLRTAGTPRVFADSVQLFYDREEFWDFCFMSGGDRGGFEPVQRAKLEELGVSTLLCVSFHVASLPKLIPILGNLMIHYGGWVALDDGEFARLYDSASIGQLILEYGRSS
jgi:hypothetical protein